MPLTHSPSIWSGCQTLPLPMR